MPDRGAADPGDVERRAANPVRSALDIVERVRAFPPRVLRRVGLVASPRGLRHLWVDLVFVGWLWAGFDAINSLAPVRQALAEHHARDLLAFERSIHLDPEHALNVWLTAHHVLRELAVLWYYNVHTIVTFGVFTWVWWRRPLLISRLRLSLILANLGALVVFWTCPVAPPRMLVNDGFRDLVSLVLHQPVWHAGATALHSNQLSSTPSLHIAWAVWSAVVLWQVCHRRALRVLVVIYPFITLFAVMATANHFFIDGVTGAVLMAAGFFAADRILALSGHRRPARPMRSPALSPEAVGEP